MKLIHILHHSVTALKGQYPDADAIYYNSGIPMRFARAERARYPDLSIECWRPEKTVSQPVVWEDEDRILHRVFPSRYLRYKAELSVPMLRAIHSELQAKDNWFFIHGSYNLHAYLLAPMLKSAPAILHSHGGFPANALFEISPHRWLRYLYYLLAPVERLTLPKYPLTFAISSDEVDYINQYLPGSVCTFSPTGIDFNHFSPGDQALARSNCGLPPNSPIIVYVGRLIPDKGIEYLIAAFPSIAEQFEDLHLYLIGSGPLLTQLRQQVTTLALNDQVKFLGHVPHSQLPDWYRSADCTVMPSLLEWFGVVAAESMACGTPVVTTDAGGAVDIVREFESGVLVPPRDVEALAQAVAAVLSGSGLAKPNVERARAKFDWTQKLRRAVEQFSEMQQERQVEHSH